jgi:hypothetical protein
MDIVALVIGITFIAPEWVTKEVYDKNLQEKRVLWGDMWYFPELVHGLPLRTNENK